MTVSYSLGPEPFWYIVKKDGTAAGGAKMYTKNSQDWDLDKIVYKDPEGTIPWTNPIVFDLNGVQGPFYWAIDPDLPDDLYYIYVNDADGNLLWSIDEYSPGSGGGGGGGGSVYIPLTNYIANNQFIDHIDETDTTLITNLVIAPSNHKGFTPALINPVVAQYGAVGPDIRFLKDSTANTDRIDFPSFPLASNPLSFGVTPVNYLRYRCTTGNTGENYKSFQFPITQKVKNLANQIMTFKIWAAVATTPVTLTAYVVQYFGSGPSASAEVKTIIDVLPLTTVWTPFFLDFTVPSVTGKTLGTDDDALYIQLWMPLNTPCEVFLAKPALYLGNIQPQQDFETYDQINSINSTPRTGDIKTSLISSAPNGWVAMNDLSIGSPSSNATNRANQDTFQLYKTIWDGVSNTWAPVQDSGGVATTRGATAVADFLANKRLVLPRSLGRALAGAGSGADLTPRALGEYLGSQVNLLSGLPSHTHTGTVPFNIVGGTGPGTHTVAYGGSSPPMYGVFPVNADLSINPTGDGAADGNMQPTSFFNVFIKL